MQDLLPPRCQTVRKVEGRAGTRRDGCFENHCKGSSSCKSNVSSTLGAAAAALRPRGGGVRLVQQTKGVSFLSGAPRIT
jgi:hypothetical protein